jgi:hypothetical protein
MSEPDNATPRLYERAGGETAVRRLMDCFAGLPEFRSALVAYIEWGTRLAMRNPQAEAEVVEHAPVPRWGWGEAPPFTP